MVTLVPGGYCASVVWSSARLVIRVWLRPTMTSPGWMPAVAAAPPLATEMMATPSAWPEELAASWAVMPSDARSDLVTLPSLISWSAMFLTVSLGMAKPMPGAAPPSLGNRAARVGMPMTWLFRLTRAPPLFPGLMAALVWIAAVIRALLPVPSPTVRPVADTIP